MDNNALSLIVTALTTGAATGLKDTASQAVKDGYGKLKALLQKKLDGTPTTLAALTEYENEPDIWKAPLEDGLLAAGADRDEEIITAARHIVTLVQAHQAGTR